LGSNGTNSYSGPKNKPAARGPGSPPTWLLGGRGSCCRRSRHLVKQASIRNPCDGAHVFPVRAMLRKPARGPRLQPGDRGPDGKAGDRERDDARRRAAAELHPAARGSPVPQWLGGPGHNRIGRRGHVTFSSLERRPDRAHLRTRRLHPICRIVSMGDV